MVLKQKPTDGQGKENSSTPSLGRRILGGLKNFAKASPAIARGQSHKGELLQASSAANRQGIASGSAHGQKKGSPPAKPTATASTEPKDTIGLAAQPGPSSPKLPRFKLPEQLGSAGGNSAARQEGAAGGVSAADMDGARKGAPGAGAGAGPAGSKASSVKEGNKGAKSEMGAGSPKTLRDMDPNGKKEFGMAGGRLGNGTSKPKWQQQLNKSLFSQEALLVSEPPKLAPVQKRWVTPCNFDGFSALSSQEVMHCFVLCRGSRLQYCPTMR
jgi:hypothetical protein